MKVPSYGVRIGGVLRCCLDREAWPEEPREGDTLTCPHGCGESLIFYSGAFEWYRPEHPLRTRTSPNE